MIHSGNGPHGESTIVGPVIGRQVPEVAPAKRFSRQAGTVVGVVDQSGLVGDDDELGAIAGV
ncbi:hypothetical protein BJ987_005375 [Nocardia goodfellowii]|uniref:Uncharacterized protein n=1 Tax=Nocardia goodfellowii TaxID=882446 RepID=A0ABS4QN68_9NOCA|nr:hypothetical protein [Nocardia goodfellowii]